MLAKRTYKNQVTIPQAIIKDFPGIEYFDVKKRKNEIVLVPVDIKQNSETLENVRSKIEKLGISQKDISKAIQSVRKN